MFKAGPIDWPGLRARAADYVREFEAGDIRWLAEGQVYLASPVSAYLERGEAEVLIQRIAEWQALLLTYGLSPVAPALSTVPPLVARGDDQIGLWLQARDHDWWMARCLPWMQASIACVIPPVPGWSNSVGTWQEGLWFAESQRRPVLLLREGGL